MKKYILLLVALLFIFNCISNLTKEKNVIKDHHKEISFLLTDVHFDINKDKTKKDGESYKINYEFIFKFRNNDNNFLINYELHDEDKNIIFKSSNVKPLINHNKRNSYFLKNSFYDILYYPEVYYKLKIEINKNVYDYEGVFDNPTLPKLDLDIGPVITKYIDGKVNVSLIVDIHIKNLRDLKWIRFIPPSQDSFWEIPWKNEFGEIKAQANIYEKNKNFIKNGFYYLQIDLEKYGIIEKKIQIVDFFNNKNGPNYGLPMATENEVNKNHIRLDIGLLEKINFMEIWIYKEINGEYQKLGIAKFLTSIEIISINELRNMVLDDFGNKVKIKYKKDYFYKVYLYSKEFNGLKYISISDLYKLNIQGFDIFDL